MTTNIQSLFGGAVGDGTLTTGGASVIVPNMAANIQAALGVSVDDVESNDVVLVTVVGDDTYSIAAAGNSAAMHGGINAVIEALCSSKSKDGILAAVWTLDRGVVAPYAAIDQVPRFGSGNMPIEGGSTPLYDRAAEALGAVVAKAASFTSAGVPVRTVTLIVTDGADNASRAHRRPENIAPLVRDMLKSEQHIIAFMGISDGGTDFTDIAKRMGIEDRWILTPKNDAKDIRAKFLLFSQSAVRASQAATGGQFSQVASGGFTS